LNPGSDEDFDAHYNALLKSLDEMVPLLRAGGEDFFADWLAQDREKIEAGKTSAVEHLLGAYGGMGSINDLFLEHRPAKLRSEIWRHADAILSALDDGGHYAARRAT
jgi:hypothetical protein